MNGRRLRAASRSSATRSFALPNAWLRNSTFAPDRCGVPASTLSGGNQQKVIIAREFTRGGRLLVAAQPTRGVDVGSTEFIHRKLIEARDNGMAVLLISAELDEVLSLADRIAVMYRGKIAGVLGADEATPEVLSYLMATGTRSSSDAGNERA